MDHLHPVQRILDTVIGRYLVIGGLTLHMESFYNPTIDTFHATTALLPQLVVSFFFLILLRISLAYPFLCFPSFILSSSHFPYLLILLQLSCLYFHSFSFYSAPPLLLLICLFHLLLFTGVDCH
ncbi:hypothetical protein XELAEV_18016188mg [Xenopus laevis]|uniref:Uncharacterized protein n=1 Tax=Xenopus laevis TaxID=8355 RepID=A0A974HX47_XENLA|nr:hypothetical protein XELAEV_18016188mg [Xenopus laevis]